jgi:hypothetical protein
MSIVGIASAIQCVALRCGFAATIGGLASGIAAAQTFGLATMQAGTLNHTTGSAIAKVVKERPA